MKLESIITLILGLAVGAVVGHVLGVRSVPESPPAPPAVMPVAEDRLERDDPWLESGDESLFEETMQEPPALIVQSEWAEPDSLEDMRQENEELQQQVSELLNWIDQNLPAEDKRTLDDLRTTGLKVLTADGRLNPDIASVLSISGSAYDGVSDILAETYDALVALREEKMEVRQRRNRGLNIRIPGLGEEGEALRSDLQDALQAQLGDERYNTFMESTWNDLEKQFFYFGQGRESLRFRSYTDKGTGEPRIWYQDRYYFPQGLGNTIIYQHNGSSSNVPVDYERYIEWER